MTPTATVLAAGDTLAGYRIEDVIGWGGMAVVYRAEQISLGRRVALKVLAPQLSRDEAFRERFRREGKHAAALDHPHVVTIFDSGDDGGRLYMAMRLVEGTTLAERMSADGLTAEETLALLTPIADALDAAHRLGLVHRDIKPQNILIGSDGHPYLADFGVAKTTTATSGLTAAGGFVGSVHYASPEQITGGPTTAAGDVYALTAVLYQCLTGQVPYPRDTEAGVMHAHVHDPPPTLAPLSPGAEALDAVIARGMAKEASDRYRRASDLMIEATAAVGALPPSRRRAVPAVAPRVAAASPSKTAHDGEAALIRPARQESPATRIDNVPGRVPLAPRTVAGGSRGAGRRGSRSASELTTADQRREPVIAESAKPADGRNRRGVRAMLAVAGIGLVVAAGAGVVLSGVLTSPSNHAKLTSGPRGQSPAIADTGAGAGPTTGTAPPTTTGTTSGGTTGTSPGTGSVAPPTGGPSGNSGPAGTYSLVAGVSGPVIVRAGPSTHARPIARIASSARVAIVCTTTGQPQTRAGATDTTWDRIASPAGFVSDTLVKTGSQSGVARPCTASDSPGTGAAGAKPTHPGQTPPANPPPPPDQQGGGPNVPTPPAPSGLASTPSQFRRFTIQRPGGDWVLEHAETVRAGYVDTRWHLRGSPNVVFVVDYTDGFYGDEVAAANSVRQLYSNVSSYQQLDFSRTTLGSAVARRWEYIDGPEHSVDIFLVACNTSFAIRGGTPVDGWSRDYNVLFFDAAASLTPSC